MGIFPAVTVCENILMKYVKTQNKREISDRNKYLILKFMWVNSVIFCLITHNIQTLHNIRSTYYMSLSQF